MAHIISNICRWILVSIRSIIRLVFLDQISQVPLLVEFDDGGDGSGDGSGDG